MPTTVAAYVVVQDNELLVEAAAPQQAFPCFDAPDEDENLPRPIGPTSSSTPASGGGRRLFGRGFSGRRAMS